MFRVITILTQNKYEFYFQGKINNLSQMRVFKIVIANGFFLSESKDFLSSNLVSGGLPHDTDVLRGSSRVPAEPLRTSAWEAM